MIFRSFNLAGSDALATLHHTSAYQQHLCHLIGTAIYPTLNSLATLVWQQYVQVVQMRRQNIALRVSLVYDESIMTLKIVLSA